jgi:hypothetical protein
MKPFTAQHRVSCHWLIITLAVSILVAVAGCSSNTGGTSATLPSGSTILAGAEQAPLKDATFTLSTLQAYQSPNTGSGMLTTFPKRTVTVIGTGTEEVRRLTDSTGYFLLSAGASGADKFKTCIMQIVQNDPDVALFLLQPDFLDYAQLQELKVLGSEKMNGIATWHLVGSRPVTGPLARTLPGPEIVKEDLWFRKNDFYPTKLTYAITPTSGGVAYEVITLVFLKWDTGLTLPVPSLSIDPGCSGQTS